MDSEILKYTDIVLESKTEIEDVTGIHIKDLQSASRAGMKMVYKGAKFAVITLGEKGAALIYRESSEIVSAPTVEDDDSNNSAFETFVGSFASKLANKGKLVYENILESVRYANKITAIALKKEGIINSIPTREEIERA